MARFEIVIDDADRGEVSDDSAWTASLYLMDEETGRSSEPIAVGFSGTPMAAVEHVLMAVTEGDADEELAPAFLETGAIVVHLPDDPDLGRAAGSACGRLLGDELDPRRDVLDPDPAEVTCEECR